MSVGSSSTIGARTGSFVCGQTDRASEVAATDLFLGNAFLPCLDQARKTDPLNAVIGFVGSKPADECPESGTVDNPGIRFENDLAARRSEMCCPTLSLTRSTASSASRSNRVSLDISVDRCTTAVMPSPMTEVTTNTIAGKYRFNFYAFPTSIGLDGETQRALQLTMTHRGLERSAVNPYPWIFPLSKRFFQPAGEPDKPVGV
ncbi:MAG: hypothetical protein R3D43_13275 [Tepidamorphaceae bacterium]